MPSEAYELQLFEAAYKYLEMRSGYISEEDREHLVQSPLFWKWWTNQWERRNAIVLHTFNYTDYLMVPGENVRRRARIAYDATHQVHLMNFIINRNIVRSTFAAVCIMEGIKKPANKKHEQPA